MFILCMLNSNRIDSEIFTREQATICFMFLSFDNDVLLPVANDVVLHIATNIMNNDVLP